MIVFLTFVMVKNGHYYGITNCWCNAVLLMNKKDESIFEDK